MNKIKSGEINIYTLEYKNIYVQFYEIYLIKIITKRRAPTIHFK